MEDDDVTVVTTAAAAVVVAFDNGVDVVVFALAFLGAAGAAPDLFAAASFLDRCGAVRGEDCADRGVVGRERDDGVER